MAKEQLNEPIDVLEHKINRLSPVLLKILLKDNTTKENLRWATSTYEKYGRLYAPEHQMLPEQMIGSNINLLTPRVSKTTEEQLERTKQKGEVFTPAWCCNTMNNFLDEDWFGKKNVFNKETEGGWITKKKKITFSKKLGKTWQEYVADIRIEIACGEAPYLVSRYDVVKGEIIPVEERIGILDRKLRVINENTEDEETWLEQAEIAYKSTYGYDYQGDNVLIARENLLYTLIDNMEYRFQSQPNLNILKKFATIISWNIWQMNGLDYTVPFSEKEVENDQIALFSFGDEEKKIEKTPVKIKNWMNNKVLKYSELMKGDSKMKFTYVIGNPPYQGVNHQQIYTDFYLQSRMISDCTELIFPVGWQEPKNANNLSKLNNPEIKEDPQIVFIDNKQNVFPGISGAEWTNIIMWKKDYNNGHNGKQLILTNGTNPEIKRLSWDKKNLTKPFEIDEIARIVEQDSRFKSISEITSVLKPYGLRTDVIKDYKKYNLAPLYNEKQKDNDIKIYAKSGLVLYVPFDYQFPKKGVAFSNYKVFIPYAWGNMSEGSGLGGAFSDIIIGFPFEACTETYLESGSFNDYETAKKHAKFLMTKFARALLYKNKYSQHSTTSWDAIPVQDYSEHWWNLSIDKIDDKLFEKYNVPNNIKQFVMNNFQTKTEKNIVNYQEDSNV